MSTTEIPAKSEELCKGKDLSDSNACILSTNSSSKDVHYDDQQHGDQERRIESENVYHQTEKNTLTLGSVVNSCSDEDQNYTVTNNNQLVSFPGNNTLQVVSTETLDNGTSTIYLLVSNESSNPVLQPVDTHNQVADDVGVGIITGEENMFKSINNNDNITSTTQQQHGSIVQVMSSNGVPVNLNVNDLLNSLTQSRNTTYKKDNAIPGILNLSNSIISTTENSSDSSVSTNQNKSHATTTQHLNEQYIFDSPSSVNQITSVPSWALLLRDCTLCGDTYTGFVTNEVEMDAVLNLYKKETQSLFAIRQTPSPAKDESADTVRLMWKSQYVPYDGIPFVNVGRRATVMECEHGPRKRSNALKRMAQMHGHGLKKVPNLTCPARLFVKKVRKFPQFRVPLEADPKVVRTLQEQSLKLVRQAGIHTGEVRLYMQLPLPSAHRYHHIGNSIEIFQKELENLDDCLMDSMSVDSRVLEKIQEIVRQGYINPFLVRSAAKDFVENKMQLNVNEGRPFKHNKAFYPALIEIQNIILQTEVAISKGTLTSLPKPEIPPVPVRPKRKRTSTIGATQTSPLVIKRVKVDIPADVTSLTEGRQAHLDSSKEALISSDGTETIALTLTDNQLESFSVTNFTYEQLAQLAKIGLIALNNATKDGDENDKALTDSKINETVPQHQTISMTDGESILVVTPNNAEEEKARLRILTGSLESPNISTDDVTESVENS